MWREFCKAENEKKGMGSMWKKKHNKNKVLSSNNVINYTLQHNKDPSPPGEPVLPVLYLLLVSDLGHMFFFSKITVFSEYHLHYPRLSALKIRGTILSRRILIVELAPRFTVLGRYISNVQHFARSRRDERWLDILCSGRMHASGLHVGQLKRHRTRMQGIERQWRNASFVC